MSKHTITLAALLVSGCVTGGREQMSPPADLDVAQAPGAERIPAPFHKPPWSVIHDPGGELVFIQNEARLQFAPRAGEMERNKIRVFDQRRNDVGFFYGGVFAGSQPKCVYALSVYVYPATEPLPKHLEAVRAEIVRANPGAKPTARTLNLDGDHKGTGVHAGYVNEVHGLESFAGVSLYARAGWFIKYRITMGPAGDPACEERVRSAVAGMQTGEGDTSASARP